MLCDAHMEVLVTGGRVIGRTSFIAGSVAVATLASLTGLSAASAKEPAGPIYNYPGSSRLCGPTADTVPPVATAFTFEASTVDVTNASASVPVTVAASDSAANASGVKRVEVAVRGPRNYIEARMHLTSGDASSGTWTGSLTVPQGAKAGVYTLQQVSVTDKDRNTQYYGGYSQNPNAISLQSGWDSSFAVTDGSTPPSQTKAGKLTGFSFSPRSVDTTEGSKRVTVRATFAAPYPTTLRAEFFNTEGRRGFGRSVRLKPVTGAPGSFKGRFTVGQWVGKSTASANLQAFFGGNTKPRFRFYNTADLAAQDFPTSLNVRGASDRVKPTLTGLSLSSDSVDTTTGKQSLTVTAQATDALSGVHQVSVTAYHRGRSGGDTSARLKLQGSDWVGQLTFRQCITPGAWKLEAFVRDHANNYQRYRPHALSTAGFTAAVQVTSTPVDHQSPGVADATASAIDHTITLDFSEGVKNVSTSTLTVYPRKPAATRYSAPADVTGIECSDGFSQVDCSGSGSLVTSARLTVPAVTAGAKFEVWGNQDEVTSQLTDATGNPLYWGYAVARVTGS